MANEPTITIESAAPPKSTAGRTSSIPAPLIAAMREALEAAQADGDESDGWRGTSERFESAKLAGNRRDAWKRALDGLDVDSRVFSEGTGKTPYRFLLRVKPAAVVAADEKPAK